MAFLRKLEILAGEVIEFPGNAKERAKHAPVHKKKSKKSDEDLDFEYSTQDSEHKIAALKHKYEIVDLGTAYIHEDLPDEFIDIQQEYLDQVEKATPLEAKRIAKEFEKKYPKWKLKEQLAEVFKQGEVDTLATKVYRFYLLPPETFGKVNTGPSSNLLEPSEHEILDKLNKIVDYWAICIYSDKKNKYQKIVDEIIKDAENTP